MIFILFFFFLWVSAINLLLECMCSNKRLHCLPCSVWSVELSELVSCLSQIQWALYFDLWFRIHPLKCSLFLQIGRKYFFCVWTGQKFFLQILLDSHNLWSFSGIGRFYVCKWMKTTLHGYFSNTSPRPTYCWSCASKELKVAEALSLFVFSISIFSKSKFNEMAEVIQETFRWQIHASKNNHFVYFCNM